MKNSEPVLDAVEVEAQPGAPAVSVPQFLKTETSEFARFTPVLTLVLWLGCSVVGVLGFALPYETARAAKVQPEPMQVEMLNVELSDEPLPQTEPTPANTLATPPPPEAVAQPQLPQAIAVAMPSPAVTFAVPVEGPARIVDAAHASSSSAPVQNAVAAPPVQVLTYGQGAGKQPAPDYPARAQDAGQEGVVNVRFTVGEDGRVVMAEAINASPWPLLNESAVRTVRNRWRFPAGTARAYQVAIRFLLPK